MLGQVGREIVDLAEGLPVAANPLAHGGIVRRRANVRPLPVG